MSSIRDKQEQAGDIPLFNRVYQDHYRVLYAFLLGHVGGDAESASDMLQETFVRAWRHISDLRAVPDERRRFWLLRIARNLTNDHYRRQAVRNRAEETIIIEAVESIPSGDPAQVVESRETEAAVDTAIDRLPVELRTVLTMHVLGGLNSTEIGKTLGRPAGTVRYQLSEARRRIAEYLRLADTESAKEGAKAL